MIVFAQRHLPLGFSAPIVLSDCKAKNARVECGDSLDSPRRKVSLLLVERRALSPMTLKVIATCFARSATLFVATVACRRDQYLFSVVTVTCWRDLPASVECNLGSDRHLLT